jgi:hypothetical protein
VQSNHPIPTGRRPSQMPWSIPSTSGKCPDCYDTGTMTVTLFGVRDGDRYERRDEPCHCPKGGAA